MRQKALDGVRVALTDVTLQRDARDWVAEARWADEEERAQVFPFDRRDVAPLRRKNERN